MLVEEFFWPEVAARAGEEAKEAIDMFAHLDDFTLVTEERFLEDAIRAMVAAFARARLVVNQLKGTVWTSTGLRRDTERVGAMWDNAEDHEGFVLAGCLGTYNDQSSQAPTPIPVGNASYIERFLQKRAGVIPAGLLAAQAASRLERECIPERSIHLLWVLGTDATEDFCKSVDETVLKAAKRILDLPEFLQ